MLLSEFSCFSDLRISLKKVSRSYEEEEKIMLAIFHKAFAHLPEELNSPSSASAVNGAKKLPKLPEDTLKHFLSSYPSNTFSITFGDAAVLSYVPSSSSSAFHTSTPNR